MSANTDEQCAENTDRELWRESGGPDPDAYAPSIHVTKNYGIGINVGGRVFVMTLRDWHALAAGLIKPAPVAPVVNEKEKQMSKKPMTEAGGAAYVANLERKLAVAPVASDGVEWNTALEAAAVQLDHYGISAASLVRALKRESEWNDAEVADLIEALWRGDEGADADAARLIGRLTGVTTEHLPASALKREPR